MTAPITHDSSIEWPNGLGWTPCSTEFAEAIDKSHAMSDFGRISMEDMSPADYETYNRLLMQIDTMIADGHRGKPERY